MKRPYRKLSDNDRRHIVHLRFTCGLSVPQISSRLSCRYKAVTSFLNKYEDGDRKCVEAKRRGRKLQLHLCDNPEDDRKILSREYLYKWSGFTLK